VKLLFPVLLTGVDDVAGGCARKNQDSFLASHVGLIVNRFQQYLSCTLISN
jgi:hypothetical protein